AWAIVVYEVQKTNEWMMKHPGQTPQPPPGPDGRMPLPNGLPVVEEVARVPGLIQRSCVDHGGTNEFLFEVVRRLRTQDKRWGLNWKRAVVGTMSQDAITYFYGQGPMEGSRDVYVIDIIVGHCGDRPGPKWTDVTVAPGQPSNAIWTLQPCPSCQ
ncbi:MAG: hypothetical protein ABL958_20020, partial [Bdellovibrionia bacterium]